MRKHKIVVVCLVIVLVALFISGIGFVCSKVFDIPEGEIGDFPPKDDGIVIVENTEDEIDDIGPKEPYEGSENAEVVGQSAISVLEDSSESVQNNSQKVIVGNVSFDISNLYANEILDEDDLYGIKLSEYDREGGMVVFGYMNSSGNLEQYMFQLSSQLVDADEYEYLGETTEKYGEYDWHMNLYKSHDGTTGSLIGCTTIENQFTCVFLHCLWTDYTETEFVEILSSAQMA